MPECSWNDNTEADFEVLQVQVLTGVIRLRTETHYRFALIQ
jgi:hypothetical protein